MSLDTELDTLIAGARGAEAPPPHVRVQVRQKLAEQLRQGVRDPAFERAVLPAPVRRWPRAATWGVPGVVIGSALWLALRLAPQTADPLVRGPEPRPVLAPAPTPPAVAEPLAAPGRRDDRQAGAVPAVEREATPAARPPVRSARVQPPAVASPARAPAAGPDLLAESQALARVQQALRAGQHAHALRLLGEQEREFSRGALHEERAAARAMALCGAGERAAGERAAAAFAARYPESVLSARVRGSCARGEP